MSLSKAQLRRARRAARQPRGFDGKGMKTVDPLVGAVAVTAIVVPRTGRLIALEQQVLTADTVREIRDLSSVERELVWGFRPMTVFQTSQAQGTGLVDEDGRVY